MPMEISDVSLNACEYVLKRFPEASITVIHCITGLLYTQPTYMSAQGVTQDMDRRDVLEKKILKHLKLDSIPKNMNIQIYYGEPVSVITSYIEGNDFDAVVIGARDNYNLFDRIIGTTALGIVKRNKIPVYVIPHSCTYKENKKIIVASDDHIADQGLFTVIKQIIEPKAQVKFLHINEINDGLYDVAKQDLIKNMIEESQSPYEYEFQEFENQDVVNSLINIAFEYDADLLIALARNKSFLHSLIFKSVSKELILNASIPMLFLHVDAQ